MLNNSSYKSTAPDDDDDCYCGPVDADPEDDTVKKAAQQALRQYNRNSEEPNYRFIVKIIGAKSFLNAGYQLDIKMMLGHSTSVKKSISADEFDALTDEHAETDARDRKAIVAMCIFVDEDAASDPCKEIKLLTDWTPDWRQFEDDD